MKAKALPTTLALAAAMFFSAATAAAQSRTFHVDSGSSRIHFTSDAPLETISGVGSGMTGEFSGDPTNLSTVRGTLEVPVETLRTGIDLRDHHLRSDTWLDAARFPTAKFEITRVTGAQAITPGQEINVQIHGRFTLHGHTHEVTAPARVMWVAENGQPSNTIRVRAHFGIHLTDYGVSVPSIVQLKVSNDIAIDISVRATSS